MSESEINSMSIIELHALAEEIRVKLSYDPPVKERNKLYKQLKLIETNIDERYLDC